MDATRKRINEAIKLLKAMHKGELYERPAPDSHPLRDENGFVTGWIEPSGMIVGVVSGHTLACNSQFVAKTTSQCTCGSTERTRALLQKHFEGVDE